jgi:hypothetical protein
MVTDVKLGIRPKMSVMRKPLNDALLKRLRR